MTLPGAHVPAGLLARYARDAVLPADELWAVEAHLESCAGCRDRLGAAVRRSNSDTAALLDRVAVALDAELARAAPAPRLARTPLLARLAPVARPAPVARLTAAAWRRRWLGPAARWVAPVLLPRIGMTVLVVLTALGIDLAARATGSGLPSVVLLLAPIAPLLGVAAAWSGRLDPAHEVVIAAPRAGLELVLRRTLAVLVVVIPVLLAAGWLVDASPARWLLPCLAYTAGALALGEVVDLHRAATGLALLWAAVVVAPSLVTERLPVLLEPVSLPGWAALAAVVAVTMVIRRDAYTALPGGR